MNIEQDLHRALARQPAPPDLADRVMRRIEGEPTATGGWAGRHVRWLAAAAAVVLVAGGTARYYEQQQQQVAEAQRVQQEIRLALQITSRALSHAQERIEETTGNRR